MKALIISADKFEDSELLVPYYRLQEAAIDVVVAFPPLLKRTAYEPCCARGCFLSVW